MNILLAGAGGFIGKNLYKNLINNYEITALTASENHKDFIAIDLTNKAKVNNYVKKILGCDVLIFLVGLAHEKGNRKKLNDFRKINYDTLVNLLSSLDKANKLPNKIIYASTISVYGEKISKNIIDESSIPDPLSPYAITKLKSEKYLQKNFANIVWILRFSPVYSYEFLRNIDRRTKIGNIFYKPGQGNNSFSLCNIKNINIVINSILENKVPSGVYNISDKNKYSYKEVLEWINAKRIIAIPVLFLKIVYKYSKIVKNIFLYENSIKLISDNYYPSDKINNYVELPFNIYTIDRKNV